MQSSSVVGTVSTLSADEGEVEILTLADGLYRVTLKPHSSETYMPCSTCETSLPPDVIAVFLQSGFHYLCDALSRHDGPTAVSHTLRTQLLAYVGADGFSGKRMLDFGCGSGASTFGMAEMFPGLQIVGVELNAELVALGNRVLAVRGFPNVRFLASPDPNSLPDGIGTFDFIMLSAVYEHLLPQERRELLPLLWSRLNSGGILFINQTPHRYFPFEHHTTGLWFLNYLPNGITHLLARKISRINCEANRARDWQGLLRGGIRGGTEPEILRNLRAPGDGAPVVMQPLGQDRAAYWLSRTSPNRLGRVKKCIAGAFRISDRLFGTVPSMNLDVAIRKEAQL